MNPLKLIRSALRQSAGQGAHKAELNAISEKLVELVRKGKIDRNQFGKILELNSINDKFIPGRGFGKNLSHDWAYSGMTSANKATREEMAEVLGRSLNKRYKKGLDPAFYRTIDEMEAAYEPSLTTMGRFGKKMLGVPFMTSGTAKGMRIPAIKDFSTDDLRSYYSRAGREAVVRGGLGVTGATTAGLAYDHNKNKRDSIYHKLTN